jgi:hypothetical protein
MGPNNKKPVEACVCRLTVHGRRFYPWRSSSRIAVLFSKTRTHCYLPDGTVLRKVKGGLLGGNYAAVEGGDIYRVWT